MCHTFTSCSKCLTSGDPICGWCPLSGMCTRQSNCPSVAPVTTPIWINQASSCPAIETISPEIVYIPDLSVSWLPEFTNSKFRLSYLSLLFYYDIGHLVNSYSFIHSIYMQNTITFTLTTSNIASTLLSIYDYNCQFRFQDANGNVMISDRMATQSNGVFTCTAPPRNQLPQLADGQGESRL